MFPLPKENKEDILFFKSLVEKEKLKAVIDRKYEFENIKEAYKYVESERKVGSVVVKIIKN